MGRILLLDSHAEFRAWLAECLNDRGFDVDEAGSAPQALELLARNIPSLVVLDLDLPVVGGMEFLRHMRGRGHFQRIEAVVLTEVARPRDVYDAARLRISAFLSKRDFQWEPFLRKVQTLVPEAPMPRGRNFRDPLDVVEAVGEAEQVHRRRSNDSDDTPRIDLEHFLRRVAARPFRPEVTRIVEVCCSPDCAVADLEHEVRASPVLAARVLRQANSAAHSRRGKVTRLAEAIGVIGIEPLRELVTSSSIEEHFLDTFQEERAWRAWQHGLVAGSLLEAMQGPGTAPIPGSEYMLGLGLGLVPLVVLQNLDDELLPLRSWFRSRLEPPETLYAELFGVPAEEVVRGVLERTGLPRGLVEPLALHARFRAAGQVPRDPAGLALDCAHQVAHAMGFMLSPRFPLRVFQAEEIERLPGIRRLPGRWREIRQEVLVRSFDLARDSASVREILGRPYFTNRDDLQLEIRAEDWLAPFGPLRAFLESIGNLVGGDELAEPKRRALILVGDHPETLLREGDDDLPKLVLHRGIAGAETQRVGGIATLAMPCPMATLAKAVHAL